MAQEIIEVTSEEEEYDIDRRAILKPVIGHVIDALGGFEGESYKMGDEVNGCLKDLKKLWRKDDTDDERTVARLFWEARLLPNDLVPILLETAGKGLVEDKRAISCVDLMTAMTWPIDLAEELKELDEELDKSTDYTQLMQSHLHYKMALLKPGVIQALFGIILSPLAKDPKERQERDGQIINVVLHLIRNLAFIKDLPANSHLSSDQAGFSNLQSKLTRVLSETHTLDLLLTIAANAENDPLFHGWNTLVLEILYLLLRGVKPTSLTVDQKKVMFLPSDAHVKYSLNLFCFSNQLKISSDFSYLKIATVVTLLAKPLLDTHALGLPSPSNSIQAKNLYLQMATTRLTHRPRRGHSSSIDNKLSMPRLEVLWI